MKKLLALLLATVMLCGLLAACGRTPITSGEDNGPQYGGTLVRTCWSNGSIDPLKVTCYDWTVCVFEQLIVYDAEGQLAPGVCDFTLSEDNLTLTLWVREGVKFHDGTDVTIEDVKASFERACKLKSQIASNVGAFLTEENAIKVENNKLILTFDEFSVETLYRLASRQPWVVVMPKRICDKYGDEYITEPTDLIGTGPYKIQTASDDGKNVTVVRFDGYKKVAEGRTGIAAPKMAYLDKIVFMLQTDAASDYLLMKAGELHMMYADSDLYEEYKKDGFAMESSQMMSAAYINFNCNKTNANLRKAIAACIDYAWMTQMEDDHISNKDTYLPVGGAYTSEKFAGADYAGAANVQLAKQYLQAAGYNNEPIKLVVNGNYPYLDVLLKPYFAAAGINLVIEQMEDGAHATFVANLDNDWHINWGTSKIVDKPTSLPPRFISDGWKNEQASELIAEMAGYALGSAESLAVWAQLDQLLADECPSVCFGWSAADFRAQHPDLVVLCEGNTDYIYNAYWKNPEAHK